MNIITVNGSGIVTGAKQVSIGYDLQSNEYETQSPMMDKLGYHYNTGTGEFEQTTPPPIRKITKRAFMQRFTQAERIAIRKSVDDIVIDIHEDLKMASIVDLDLQDTINGVAYLGSIGLLTTSQADLLRDGTEDEV
jgi:hypothetical protein